MSARNFSIRSLKSGSRRACWNSSRNPAGDSVAAPKAKPRAKSNGGAPSSRTKAAQNSAGKSSEIADFKGQIAAVEPEFGANGCIIAIRAYDKSHKLNRNKKTRTFQNVSCSNMAQKVIGENGLSANAQSTDVVHEFFQQSNETDWDFLWRIALKHDYLVVADDRTIHFQPADKSAGAPVSLTWQQELISFRPRMSGVQQPQNVEVRAWDPKSKQNVSGSAGSPATTSQPGKNRASVSSALGGGTISVTDRVAADSSEANAIATGGQCNS